MEQIIWDKLCTLSKLKYEKEQSLKRADEYDSYNNTWLAGYSLSDYQRLNGMYNQLFDEVKSLCKQIDTKRFNDMVISSYKLYNNK